MHEEWRQTWLFRHSHYYSYNKHRRCPLCSRSCAENCCGGGLGGGLGIQQQPKQRILPLWNLHSTGRTQTMKIMQMVRDTKRLRKNKAGSGDRDFFQGSRLQFPPHPSYQLPFLLLPSSSPQFLIPTMCQPSLLMSQLVTWNTYQSLDSNSVIFPIWSLSNKLLAWPWTKQRQSWNHKSIYS